MGLVPVSFHRFLFIIAQRHSSSVNDHANIVNLGTGKVTVDNSIKVNDQLFNSHIDRTVFDSLNSYSKFSSLGGTHTIKKNKRSKLKKDSTNSFKKSGKTRTKPSSSKKSTKPRLPSGQFTDKVDIQNCRSANFTSKPTKMAINNENVSQKRYQYHKRIQSDTGNTIMNPLEKAYEREKLLKSKQNKNPSFVKTKAKTDISTPMVHSEGQRSSIIEKKLPSNTLATNSIQINKYDFAPSFKQHKNNLNFDANTEYRKFKSNKHMANAHKMHSVKVKKIFKYKIAHKDNKSSDARGRSDQNYSPENQLNYENDEQLTNELNEYQYEHPNLPQIPEDRGNGTPDIHNMQIKGDQSITMSKETEEAI